MADWSALLQEKTTWNVETDEKVRNKQLFFYLEALAERVIEKSTLISWDLKNLETSTNEVAVTMECAFNTLANSSSSHFIANVRVKQTISQRK